MRPSAERARHGPRVPRRVPPIERDQPCGFGIVALDDARPAAVGVEPIEEFRQKGGPRAVDAIEPREVESRSPDSPSSRGCTSATAAATVLACARSKAPAGTSRARFPVRSARR
jgi:hypothetical protein